MSATTPWSRLLGRLILSACAAAALAAPAMAQPAGGPAAGAPAGPAAPAAPDPAATPHRDFPGGVVGLMDITYARIEGFRPLKLDLYMPKTKPTEARPLVVWLHGGGWVGGDQRGGGIATAAYRNWPATMAGLVERGYIVAGVSYRFSSEAKYPAQVQDVNAAIRWLKANAATYGIDPNRVVVWGASAGGHIAAMVGTGCKVPELQGTPVRGAMGSSCVQGVIDYYGPTDLKVADSQRLPGPSMFGDLTPNASLYLGCPIATCPASQLRLSNPMAFIDASDPPFLIMHGDADTTVPPKQSQMLQDALQKAGVKSELVYVPKTNHVFAGATDAQGKEAYDRTVAWLDALTGVKPPAN